MWYAMQEKIGKRKTKIKNLFIEKIFKKRK